MHKGSSSEHATAVLAGRTAVLIRGASGSGKSRLAWALLDAARDGRLAFARLVADDRVALSALNGKLIASAPNAIEGKIELRGMGILQVPFERFALIGLVVDLGAEDAARMPEPAATRAEILGVRLPRIPVPAGGDALVLVLHHLARSRGMA